MRFSAALALLALAGCHAARMPDAPPRTTAGENASSVEAWTQAAGGFLAAQAALRAGRLEDAARFLADVLAVDPQAHALRFTRAEVLMRLGRASEALKELEALLRAPSLPPKMRLKAELLRAQALAAQGKVDEALDLLRPRLRDAPEPVARTAAGILFARGRTREAARWLEDAARQLKGAKAAGLWLAAARLWLAEKGEGEALRAAEAAVRAAPELEEVQIFYADLLLRQRKPEAAVRALSAYLTAHPEAIRAAGKLGQALIAARRYEEAIAFYRKLARRAPRAAALWKTLGLLLLQNRRFAEAEKALREALAREDDEEIRYFLAAALEIQGKDEEAARFYREISEQSPRWAEAQTRIGFIELEAGHVERALARARRVVDRRPDFAEGWRLLAAALAEKKAWRELVRATEPALGLAHPPVELLLQIATAYEELDDLDGIERVLERARREDPGNPEVLNFLGYAWAERGVRLDEAKALIEQALAKDPDNPFYLDSLAWVYYQQKEYEKALAVQTRALAAMQKPDPVMLEHMGDILLALGRRKEAVAHWRKALEAGHPKPEKLRAKIERAVP